MPLAAMAAEAAVHFERLKRYKRLEFHPAGLGKTQDGKDQ
jgi:hypothetical protein